MQSCDGLEELLLTEEHCEKMISDLESKNSNEQIAGLARFAELFHNHEPLLLSRHSNNKHSVLLSLGIIPLIVALLTTAESSIRLRAMMALCRCTEACIQMDSGKKNPGPPLAYTIVACGGLAQMTQVLRCFGLGTSMATGMATSIGLGEFPFELYSISATAIASLVMANKCQDAAARRQKNALDMPDLLFELNTVRPMLRLFFCVLESMPPVETPQVNTLDSRARAPVRAKLDLTGAENGRVKIRLQTALQVSAVLFSIASDSKVYRTEIGLYLHEEVLHDTDRCDAQRIEVWTNLVRMLTLWQHPALKGGTDGTSAGAPGDTMGDGALVAELLLDTMELIFLLISRTAADSPEERGEAFVNFCALRQAGLLRVVQDSLAWAASTAAGNKAAPSPSATVSPQGWLVRIGGRYREAWVGKCQRLLRAACECCHFGPAAQTQLTQMEMDRTRRGEEAAEKADTIQRLCNPELDEDELEYLTLEQEAAAALGGVGGEQTVAPAPVMAVAKAPVMAKQTTGPSEINHLGIEPDEKYRSKQKIDNETEDPIENKQENRKPISPVEAMGGEDAATDMALTIVSVLASACSCGHNGNGDGDEITSEIDFYTANGALRSLSALLKCSPAVLCSARLLAGQAAGADAPSKPILPLLISILSDKQPATSQNPADTRRCILEAIRLLECLVTAAKACGEDILAGTRNVIMLNSITEALAKLLLLGYSTDSDHRAGGAGAAASKKNSVVEVCDTNPYLEQQSVANPAEGTHSPEAATTAATDQTEPGGGAQDGAVAGRFLAATVNTLTELVKGHSGNMARLLLAAKGRIGGMLVHLALRFALDLKECDTNNSESKGRGAQDGVLVDEERQEQLEVREDLERALAALDTLVFELSLFGTDASEGHTGTATRMADGDSADPDVVEMAADGTFDFDDSAKDAKQTEIKKKKGVVPSSEGREARGNHVDMAAIAENLLKSPDAAYGPNNGKPQTRKLCKCELCGDVLVNRSFTLQGCRHSFHPTCLTLFLGEKLMEGLNPTCPVCFAGIEGS
jgi:hypothetical protein